jgi:hypothetical protein
MKAISLKQPWAHLICLGEKTIETRTWPTRYRGDILIVASMKPKIQDLPVGVAVCIAEISDCRKMVIEDESKACCEIYENAYSWILENIRKIKPFPVKGKLGIYEVKYENHIMLQRTSI